MSKFGTYGLKAGQDKPSLRNWEFPKRPCLITCVALHARERRQRSDQGLSLLNPYQDYILSRWNQGYYNTQGLYEEIRQAGYPGSYATVARFTRYLKSLPGAEPEKRSRKKTFQKLSSSSQRALTPSRATALVLRRPELRESNDDESIARLQAAHSDLGSAIALAHKQEGKLKELLILFIKVVKQSEQKSQELIEKRRKKII